MRAFIEENPHVYREEMVDFIAEEFDTDVSIATISRMLQKERISHKFLLKYLEWRAERDWGPLQLAAPNEDELVACYRTGVRVWNTTDGGILRTFEFHPNIKIVTPEVKVLASDMGAWGQLVLTKMMTNRGLS